MKMILVRHGKDDDRYRGGWSNLDLVPECTVHKHLTPQIAPNTLADDGRQFHINGRFVVIAKKIL